MKKLKLNLDELKVESFETNTHSSKKGTVLGNSGTTIPYTEDIYDPNCENPWTGGGPPCSEFGCTDDWSCNPYDCPCTWPATGCSSTFCS